jgi:hypothetical protein
VNENENGEWTANAVTVIGRPERRPRSVHRSSTWRYEDPNLMWRAFTEQCPRAAMTGRTLGGREGERAERGVEFP